MKKLVLMLGLLTLLLATAFAQGNFVQTKIPFEFVVAGKTYPAGIYDFRASNQSVLMSNRVTGNSVQLMSLTRIARDKTAAGTARISFDVQEGKRFLEAVWPSEGDGYLLNVTKGDHTHEIVRSK